MCERWFKTSETFVATYLFMANIDKESRKTGVAQRISISI